VERLWRCAQQYLTVVNGSRSGFDRVADRIWCLTDTASLLARKPVC
jgi:hypothetical protein